MQATFKDGRIVLKRMGPLVFLGRTPENIAGKKQQRGGAQGVVAGRSGLKNFQLFFAVTTNTRPGTKVTFLLPHFGHCGIAASCSEMVSVRSNLFPHFSQRY